MMQNNCSTVCMLSYFVFSLLSIAYFASLQEESLFIKVQPMYVLRCFPLSYNTRKALWVHLPISETLSSSPSSTFLFWATKLVAPVTLYDDNSRGSLCVISDTFVDSRLLILQQAEGASKVPSYLPHTHIKYRSTDRPTAGLSSVRAASPSVGLSWFRHQAIGVPRSGGWCWRYHMHACLNDCYYKIRLCSKATYLPT